MTSVLALPCSSWPLMGVGILMLPHVQYNWITVTSDAEVHQSSEESHTVNWPGNGSYIYML